MNVRELERLNELLFKLSTDEDLGGADRDRVGRLRYVIDELLDARLARL